jgi:hypothetical protein
MGPENGELICCHQFRPFLTPSPPCKLLLTHPLHSVIDFSSEFISLLEADKRAPSLTTLNKIARDEILSPYL